MAETASEYGIWLVGRRKRWRISQERLAKITGIDRGHISKIESGRIDLPTYETRQRIHAALGTTEDELRALGIVRDAHGTITAGAATVHGGTVTATVDTRTRAERIDAFLAGLTPEQRATLFDLLAPHLWPYVLEGGEDRDRPRRVAEGAP
jgi:transcriptional regulator with XRE-family HTH domain